MGSCGRCGGLIESYAGICRKCAQQLDIHNSLNLDKYDPVIESSAKPMFIPNLAEIVEIAKSGLIFIVVGVLFIPIFSYIANHTTSGISSWKYILLISALMICIGAYKISDVIDFQFESHTRKLSGSYTVADGHSCSMYIGLIFAIFFLIMAFLPDLIFPLPNSETIQVEGSGDYEFGGVSSLPHEEFSYEDIPQFERWAKNEIGRFFFWPMIIAAGLCTLMLFYGIYGIVTNETGSVTLSETHFCSYCNVKLSISEIPARSGEAFECPSCHKLISCELYYG